MPAQPQAATPGVEVGGLAKPLTRACNVESGCPWWSLRFRLFARNARNAEAWLCVHRCQPDGVCALHLHRGADESAG